MPQPLIELTDDELDASPVTVTRDSDLVTVSSLAAEYRRLEVEIGDIEEMLSARKKALMTLREVDLPNAMIACRTEDYTTTDGVRVRLGLEFQSPQLDDGPDGKDKRPLADRLRALAWLDKAGHGDLAKNVVSAAIPKGEEALAEEILNFLRRHKAANRMMIDRRRTIPWNTLTAFARERDKVGDITDQQLEILGVTKRRAAKVTVKKKSEDTL